MKISDIFSSSALSNTERDEAVQSRRNKEKESLARGQRTAFGDDTVTISPVSRQLAQISKIVAEDGSSTDNKIAALKEKIANGEYDIPSDEIAQSMIRYIKENDNG